jgi:hypothetical protein
MSARGFAAVLDAGPDLSRKRCDHIALEMRNPTEFKYLRGDVKSLEKRESRKRLTDDQLARLAAVKSKLARLEEDASLNCKALAPIKP